MSAGYSHCGKRWSDGEWVRGNYVDFGADYSDSCRHAIVCDDETCNHGLVIDFVDPHTIGKSLGLEDKNGWLIFEGEIFKDDWGRILKVAYSDHFQRWQVYMLNRLNDWRDLDSKEFGTHIFDWIYPKMCLEKIGNVHDNPELLEVPSEAD